MKALLLVATVATTLNMRSQAVVSYEGSWTLDAARSTGLPDYYSRVKSHKLLITQSATLLRVNVTVDAGMGEPDQINLLYPLDGKETTTETPIRGPAGLVQVPTKLKATLTQDGAVHITIGRTIAMGGPPIDAVTTEDWSLSADGRTLTVHRIDETPRGRVDAHMVFTRSDTHG